MRRSIEGAWKWCRSRWRLRPLTLFGKTVVILLAEVILNALIWILSVAIFTTRAGGQGRGVLPLALVAWTTGLRHGLDADHISAIDNATRRIVSVPLVDSNGKLRVRRPVTVGLFFSLGHSTIVVATIVAIAISAHVADNLDGFGSVGGIIGASISSSFLILIACINSYILYCTWRRLRQAKRQEVHRHQSIGEEGAQGSANSFHSFMTRLAMPLLRAVDRPWKLYPVGVLFGLGFDTASSIALLSVAVVGQQRAGQQGGNASIILLALLFTAGMTLVDTCDSCLMIWAYAPDISSKGRRRYRFWEGTEEEYASAKVPVAGVSADVEQSDAEKDRADTIIAVERETSAVPAETRKDKAALEANESPDQLLASLDRSASQLSIILTLLSILIAFTIGIIQLLGLIGEQCGRCSAAADRQEESGNGGLEGRWWLTWRRAGDNFGYIGAAIVGVFAVVLVAFLGIRWCLARTRRKREEMNRKGKGIKGEREGTKADVPPQDIQRQSITPDQQQHVQS